MHCSVVRCRNTGALLAFSFTFYNGLKNYLQKGPWFYFMPLQFHLLKNCSHRNKAKFAKKNTRQNLLKKTQLKLDASVFVSEVEVWSHDVSSYRQLTNQNDYTITLPRAQTSTPHVNRCTIFPAETILFWIQPYALRPLWPLASGNFSSEKTI